MIDARNISDQATIMPSFSTIVVFENEKVITERCQTVDSITPGDFVLQMVSIRNRCKLYLIKKPILSVSRTLFLSNRKLKKLDYVVLKVRNTNARPS